MDTYYQLTELVIFHGFNNLQAEVVADFGAKDLLADVEEFIKADEAAGASDALHLADLGGVWGKSGNGKAESGKVMAGLPGPEARQK